MKSGQKRGLLLPQNAANGKAMPGAPGMAFSSGLFPAFSLVAGTGAGSAVARADRLSGAAHPPDRKHHRARHGKERHHIPNAHTVSLRRIPSSPWNAGRFLSCPGRCHTLFRHAHHSRIFCGAAEKRGHILYYNTNAADIQPLHPNISTFIRIFSLAWMDPGA